MKTKGETTTHLLEWPENKTLTVLNNGEDTEQKKLICCWREERIVQPFWNPVLLFPTELNRVSSCDPANPPSGIHPTDVKTMSTQKTCTETFIETINNCQNLEGAWMVHPDKGIVFRKGKNWAKGFRLPVSGLACKELGSSSSALITNTKLNKLKINNSSYIYQRIEVTGQTAAPSPKLEREWAGTESHNQLKEKLTSRNPHGDPHWVPFTRTSCSPCNKILQGTRKGKKAKITVWRDRASITIRYGRDVGMIRSGTEKNIYY